MTKDLNISPYYDDFDDSKGFHQILFKPGNAVQARELTQIQSIIRDQIGKFGNHVFRHGSVVIPGNSFFDKESSYVKISHTFDSVVVNLSNFDGKTLVGAISGVKAVVRKTVGTVGADPDTFYVSYISGGTDSNVFLESEELYIDGASSLRVTVYPSSATGHGTLAFVNDGVYYINGSFVKVDAQSVVVSKYTSVPSGSVVLRIVETILSSDDDSTLLDPSHDSYNYAAPGADRLQIKLILEYLPLDSVIDNNYVELMRFRDGVLEEHARTPTYSELEKSLAKRTYDESGDYVVSGFSTTIKENLKTQYNSGVDVNGDSTKFNVVVSPGSAYIGGFNVETLSPQSIVLDKARSVEHTKYTKTSLQAEYGKYLFVTDIKSLPDFSKHTTISLYNSHNPADGSATLVGTATALAIDYHSGDPTSVNAIYKLYCGSVVMNGTYRTQDIGGYRFSGGSGTVLVRLGVPVASGSFVVGEVINTESSTRSGTVKAYSKDDGYLYVYKHLNSKSIPTLGDYIVGATSGFNSTVRTLLSNVVVGDTPIMETALTSIKNTKTITSTYDTSYIAWKTITLTTNGSGNATYTLPAGTFVSPDVGNLVAAGTGGMVLVSKFSLSSANTLVLTAGPVSSTVVVLAQVNKSNIQPKVKTLTRVTLSGIAPTSTIALNNTDVYRIVSITTNSGVDVYSKYTLDNGQQDFHYGLATLKLNGVAPSGTLTIIFDYFAHSGTGDYFSADSYSSMGTDYLSKIPFYTTKTTSNVLDLSNCFDFRPTVGSDGTLGTSTELTDSVVVDSFLASSVQVFLPRIDIVSINKNKQIVSKMGIPSDNPFKPIPDNDSIELFSLYIPRYTEKLSEIVVTNAKNRRFTMIDINKMDSRLSNIENYSMLSAIENNLLSYEITDSASGLNRYKTGYLVDSFTNVDLVADRQDPQFRGSFRNQSLSPSVELHDADLKVSSLSTNYTIYNGQATLPYTEVPFIKQNTSTSVMNINHYMVVEWRGLMTINPPIDSWVVKTTNTKVVDVNNTTSIVRTERLVADWGTLPYTFTSTIIHDGPSIPGQVATPVSDTRLKTVTPTPTTVVTFSTVPQNGTGSVITTGGGWGSFRNDGTR